jgi:hypothetical protein
METIPLNWSMYCRWQKEVSFDTSAITAACYLILLASTIDLQPLSYSIPDKSFGMKTMETQKVRFLAPLYGWSTIILYVILDEACCEIDEQHEQ